MTVFGDRLFKETNYNEVTWVGPIQYDLIRRKEDTDTPNGVIMGKHRR